MRVPAAPLPAFAVFIAYMALIVVYWSAVGVDYDTIGDTTRNVVEGIVVPIGIGVVLLSVATTYLGWWRPALFEKPAGPRWLLVLPIVMLIATIAGIAAGDFGGREASFFIWLAVGTLFVGFCEELLTRGILVVGLRGAVGEIGVWFYCSLAFGLLHAINVVSGQDVGPTIQQVAFAFVFGSVFYVIRRVTGTLIVCMLLHGLWDFATFVQTGDDHAGTTDPSQDVNLMQPFALVAVAVAVIGLWLLLRDRSGRSGERATAAAD
jgi:membrane protease YdiL (CAAX protease family)